MPEFEIIDAHVHTYPTREMGLRTKGNVGDGNDLGGTMEELNEAMAEGAISRSVVLCLHPYADMREALLSRLPGGLSDVQQAQAEAEVEETLQARQIRRNEWTCESASQHQGIIPFIAVDPSMPTEAICREIEGRVRDNGAKGLKLHASLNRFHPYDPRLNPAYDLAQEQGLPIVFHGGNFTEGTAQYSRPKEFKDVAQRFPKLTFVLAHLGQDYFDETREIAALYPQVHFDCSAIISSVGKPGGIGSDEIVSLIREIGVERVQFGSDYPFFHPAWAAAALLSLPLTTDEKRLICADNARRTLRLD